MCPVWQSKQARIGRWKVSEHSSCRFPDSSNPQFNFHFSYRSTTMVRHISDADVLSHWALVASSPRYVKRRRLHAPVSASQLTTAWSLTEQEQKPRKPSDRHIQTKAASHRRPRILSLEDEILDQLDEQARRRTAAAQLSEHGHSSPPSLGGDTQHVTHLSQAPNILPPPPLVPSLVTPGRYLRSSAPVVPPAQTEDDDVPRPSWSFATPAPPQHTSRQNHQSSSPQGQEDAEMDTGASEADLSEVDELATPAVGQEQLAMEGNDEEEQQTDTDKTPTKAQTDEAPRLLSLPQRLWSTLRPGISLYVFAFSHFCEQSLTHQVYCTALPTAESRDWHGTSLGD